LIRYYSQPSFGLFLQTPAAFVFASGSEAIYSTVLDSAVDRHAKPVSFEIADKVLKD